MTAFKRIWFVLLLAVLFLPLLQSRYHFVDEKPLGGTFVETPKPVVNLKTLFNETAQDSLMTWYTEQAGFRNSMIRLNNQMLYSAFGKISANGVVKGKGDNNFFVMPYINSYMGETYVGEEKIQKNTQHLKLIQDMLRAKGITMLPVFVVGKASYYPELLPYQYFVKQYETNNYEAYLKAFNEQGVELIDFNRWFCERRDAEAHPVYCNLSTHWTLYAASLAMDSLVNFMESKTHQAQVHAVVENYDTTYLMEHDDELYRMMNLMFPMKHNTIAQPKFSYTQGYKPKVLVLSDSYWWVVYAWQVSLHQSLFSDGGFWYYNKTIYPKRNPIQNVESVNYKQEIESQEFVLIVCTEASNNLWPYGFIERYLTSYDNVFRYKQPEQYDAADSLYSVYRNGRIEAIIQHIKESPEWLDGIKSHAEEKGINLEEAIWNAAEYTYLTSIEPKETE